MSVEGAIPASVKILLHKTTCMKSFFIKFTQINTTAKQNFAVLSVNQSSDNWS